MISLKLLPSPGAWLVLALAALCASARAETIASILPPLPEPVTSLGAVTHDGWLYVFGGHQGERHEYTADKVSGSLHRLNLERGQSWERLPSAAPGQGQPLVAHGTSIYRVGGMAARNAPGEKQDLISAALVQRFDGKTLRWEEVVALPEPRSSHDAVVVGDRLFVVGGWQLSGGTRKPVWPDTALVLDLANPSAGWKTFPQPFRRRALSVATSGNRVICIGGMNSDGNPTLAVEIFETTTGEWSKGPDLPSGKFKGFACSAIGQGGRVYANTFQGDLLRLSADERSWEKVGRLAHPRMAHRLVTAGATQVIALGGEDGEAKRPDLELLTPTDVPDTRAPDSTSSPAAAASRP